MPEGTDFLYPFIDGNERDVGALLADLAASARAKAGDSERTVTAALAENRDRLEGAAAAIVACVARGRRVYTFGNGGSSTDAATLASLFSRPPVGTAIAARSLVDDTAVITALSNDVGFDLLFSRQLIAHARSGDVAIGLSTSGNSRDLLEAFAEAKRRGVVTIGIAGYDGGEMAAAGLDHCIIVRSDSVHRVQEAHAALGFALWREVHARLEAA